jgi:hypothetical protein
MSSFLPFSHKYSLSVTQNVTMTSHLTLPPQIVAHRTCCWKISCSTCMRYSCSCQIVWKTVFKRSSSTCICSSVSFRREQSCVITWYRNTRGGVAVRCRTVTSFRSSPSRSRTFFISVPNSYTHSVGNDENVTRNSFSYINGYLTCLHLIVETATVIRKRAVSFKSLHLESRLLFLWRLPRHRWTQLRRAESLRR